MKKNNNNPKMKQEAIGSEVKNDIKQSFIYFSQIWRILSIYTNKFVKRSQDEIELLNNKKCILLTTMIYLKISKDKKDMKACLIHSYEISLFYDYFLMNKYASFALYTFCIFHTLK